ncbi:MAG: AAA family ATPase, partial [Christensenellaceae bacterium]|nr:AAA family ATPase [Christensenellaceae bacterium]
SARVKQLDPDCEVLYLRNATPDALNGKSAYNPNTGEIIDIPPTWYKRLCKKCEAKPHLLHIAFFDELTNALPSIQGMAFNIILDKEINGLWKLPSNARIVAAGNETEDSSCANELVEPLYNRFAHIYINTTLMTWIDWANKDDAEYAPLRIEDAIYYCPQKIHPLILSYVRFTDGKALRTPFTGKEPNADPRKWEFASKLLYSSKKPKMLRALVGKEVTKEFCAFLDTPIISIEDIIMENYTAQDIATFTMNDKIAHLMALQAADETQIGDIRRFILLFGKEFLSAFDLLWAGTDTARKAIIRKIR